MFYLFEITDNSRAHPVYPELVGVVGRNVPNYQGVFLRGYGGQTSYHYGAVGHWSAGLGELQGDTIRNITGDIESVLNRGGYHRGARLRCRLPFH